jgi:hypothetical protein
MTAISFNTTSHAASPGPHAPARRDTCATDAMAAVSHVEMMIKRVCKFSLTIVLLTAVAAGIVALKVAIWIPHFSH